jgi:hypothetical protein
MLLSLYFIQCIAYCTQRGEIQYMILILILILNTDILQEILGNFLSYVKLLIVNFKEKTKTILKNYMHIF